MNISATSASTTTYYQPPGPPPVTPPAGLPEVAGTQLHLHGHRKPNGTEASTTDQTGNPFQPPAGGTGGVNFQA